MRTVQHNLANDNAPPLGPFLKTSLTLAIPIALQNLLTSCAALIDTSMVVKLGNIATSAIGVAGRFPFFLNIICFGLCSGSAAMISQYWGARDHRGIHRTFGVLSALSLAAAVLFSILLYAIPAPLMRIFSDDEAVVALGAQYLRIYSFGALLNVFNQMIGAALRAVEQVTVPLISSMFSVVLNAFMNYCLINGNFGFPALGLRGAAIATVLSIALQALILLVYFLFFKNALRASLRAYFDWEGGFFYRYARFVAPALINEVLWGIGTNIYVAVLARQGTDYHSGYTVFETIQQLFFVFFVGMAHAASIIIGKSVGEGRHAVAKTYAKRFFIMTPLMGVFFGIIVILTRYPILGMFEIETELAMQTAAQCLVVYAVWLGFRMIPYTAICGVFRAGGDTVTGCVFEISSMYLISIPIVLLLGIFTDVPFVLLVACMYVCEDLPKMFFSIRHFRTGKWIKQITETSAQAEGNPEFQS